jgi:hypothetical protein
LSVHPIRDKDNALFIKYAFYSPSSSEEGLGVVVMPLGITRGATLDKAATTPNPLL